jgi:hypothetical protein
MIKKRILNPQRVRRIEGGFSYIPHRFLTDGFLSSLDQHELLLYLFLALVSDRHGLSFYGYDAICSLLYLSLDQYIDSRDGLIEKDLIAFDGTIFQVLALPAKPLTKSNGRLTAKSHRGQTAPASLAQILRQSLREASS